MPRLRARSLPATLFVVTGCIRATPAGPTGAWSPGDDEEFLAWPEIEEMNRDPSLTIGSHARTHRSLTLITADAMRAELTDSLAMLRDRLGPQPRPIAYPFGRYNAAVAAAAAETGYTCALTTDEGRCTPETPLFALRRILVGDDAPAAYSARVTGLSAWVRPLQRLTRPGRPVPAELAGYPQAPAE